MKAYLNQIFYEGLGAIIYYPIESKLKKISNKKISISLINITKTIYLIIIITLVCYLLYYQLS